MLRIFITIIVFSFFFSQFSIFHFRPVSFVEAVYDPLSVPNNKYGIHILEPNELEKASELVNTTGGKWGYVTIPIRANDRDIDKWTKFMLDAKKYQLIPILRIATYPLGDHWMAPNAWDLVDFSNFLNDLPWPVKNRYIMIYNEPNHKGEWGGFVYPEEYARTLDMSIDIFHKKNPDFFVISAGLDASAPNGADSMDNLLYLRRMENYIPGIFKKIDGFSSHAYGNPAFATRPNAKSQVNIKSYLPELSFLKSVGVENPPLFLSEAGWKADSIGEENAVNWYKDAFQNYWLEPDIVAITPFLLSAPAGPFQEFSFTFPNGEFENFAKAIINIPKQNGSPILPENRSKEANSLQTNVILTGQKNENLLNLSDLITKFLEILNVKLG